MRLQFNITIALTNVDISSCLSIKLCVFTCIIYNVLKDKSVCELQSFLSTSISLETPNM